MDVLAIFFNALLFIIKYFLQSMIFAPVWENLSVSSFNIVTQKQLPDNIARALSDN